MAFGEGCFTPFTLNELRLGRSSSFATLSLLRALATSHRDCYRTRYSSSGLPPSAGFASVGPSQAPSVACTRLVNDSDQSLVPCNKLYFPKLTFQPPSACRSSARLFPSSSYLLFNSRGRELAGSRILQNENRSRCSPEPHPLQLRPSLSSHFNRPLSPRYFEMPPSTAVRPKPPRPVYKRSRLGCQVSGRPEVPSIGVAR